MGMTLKPDKIEPVPISVPVVIEPPATPGVETMPMAPQPIRMVRHHWGRAAARVLKICLLLSEIPIILALVGYAGVLHLLPATPPPARISLAEHSVQAAPGVYCWFRPGHADCQDPPPPAITALPVVTSAKGQTATLAFTYPPPTGCATSAWPANAAATAAKPAGALAPASGRTLMQAHYTLTVDLPPGTYRLDVNCQWTPLAALRWLQGSGSATYSLVLKVPPTTPPAKAPPSK